MKRMSTWIGVLVMLCAINSASAQGIYLGITGGMNLSDAIITGDGLDQEVDGLSLFGVGGVLGIEFGKHLALQLRPLYLMKGGMLIQDLPAPDIDIRGSVIEIDGSLKFSMGKWLRPYLLAGPTIAFVLNQEAEAELTGVTLEADLRDVMKKVEWGIGLGAGLELALGPGFLFAEGRYVIGLNNLNLGGEVEFTLDGTVIDTDEIDAEDTYKNRGFQIMAGYAIRLGR